MSMSHKIIQSLKFDSLGSCLDYAEFMPTPFNYRSCHTYQTDSFNLNWSGGSFGTAISLARKGWPEGLKLIRKSEDLIVAKLNSGTDIVRTLEASGDEVDVPLFLEGDPEHMVNYKLDDAKKPVVRLVVSLSASCSIDNETITMRGAAICAAIDAVESCGSRVELIADSTWCIRGKIPLTTAQYRIVVKHAGDSLDREKIAYVLMHPTMLRQIIFRLTESSDLTNPSFVSKSYGFPVDPIEDDNEAVYIGCMRSDDNRWSTTESAVAATKQLIEKLSAKAV